MFPHSPLNQTTNKMVSSHASSHLANTKSSINSNQRVEFSRRIILPLLISVASVPDTSESQRAFFQGKP